MRTRKFKNQEIEAVKKMLPKIAKAKAYAAKARERLRNLSFELGDIVDSFSNGNEALNSAKRSLEEAVEEMSKYV